MIAYQQLLLRQNISLLILHAVCLRDHQAVNCTEILIATSARYCSLDYLGVKLYADYSTTRRVNGELMQKMVKDQMNSWKSGKFLPLAPLSMEPELLLPLKALVQGKLPGHEDWGCQHHHQQHEGLAVPGHVAEATRDYGV